MEISIGFPRLIFTVSFLFPYANLSKEKKTFIHNSCVTYHGTRHHAFRQLFFFEILLMVVFSVLPGSPEKCLGKYYRWDGYPSDGSAIRLMLYENAFCINVEERWGLVIDLMWFSSNLVSFETNACAFYCLNVMLYLSVTLTMTD